MGSKCVALLRGINLGARNRLPMKTLVEIFEASGCSEVSTYIQSGNVLFRPPAVGLAQLSERVTAEIARRCACRAPVVLRTLGEMKKAIAENPFVKLGHPEKALHVYFLGDAPKESAIGRLDPNRSPGDAFEVLGREVYLYLPNGMGHSKLTNAYFDAKLGTISTARNWATTLKLGELMAS